MRSPIGGLPRRAAAGAVVLLAAIAPAAAQARVEAILADREVPEDQLLDVGIQVFDPGLPQPDPRALEAQGVFPEVRRSEARYIPFQLKTTLESTGHWGAVRLVPAGTGATDLTVTGKIRASTGFRLDLALRVVDSRGKVWRDQTYRDQADPKAYDPDRIEARDPYQSLYNRIANDLLESLRSQRPKEIQEIRRITRLRFGADLAPIAYAEYLKVNDRGRYRIGRLPADDDPMLARIGSVRERDLMFVDTLNEYYADFHARMDQPYLDWRSYAYEEEKAARAIRRQAMIQKVLGGLLILGGVAAGMSDSTDGLTEAAVLGGAMVVQSGVEKGKEAKIHKAAIQELAASFDSEVEPLLVEVEGQTLRLEGSAEAQFTEWRRLLHEIFLAETGLPPDPNSPPAGGRGRATAN
jgi:hypothetical protein